MRCRPTPLRKTSTPHSHAPRGSRSHSVVLVHGVLGQSLLYWNRVKAYLRSDQNHFHEVRLPFFGFGDLRKSAAHLAQEVDRVLTECAGETEDNKVDLVAHSAGGLVARYFIRRLGGAARVHSLITLGTPHQGTRTSFFVPFNRVALQTLPQSDFLRALNAGPDTASHVHYTSIYTRHDLVVVPWKNARLEGAVNIEIPFLTHWGFLWSREVYEHIREAIDHAPGSYPDYEPGAESRPSPRRGRRAT